MHSPRLRSTCDPHRSGKSNFCAASGRHAISPWRDYGDQTGISACSKSGRAETARDDSFEQQRLLSLSADRRKESRNAPRSSKNTSSCGPRVGWARAAGYTHLLDWPLDDQQIWMQTGAGPLLSPLSDGIERYRRAGASRSHRPPFAEMIVDQFEELLEQPQPGRVSRTLPDAAHSDISRSFDSSGSPRAPTAGGGQGRKR